MCEYYYPDWAIEEMETYGSDPLYVPPEPQGEYGPGNMIWTYEERDALGIRTYQCMTEFGTYTIRRFDVTMFKDESRKPQYGKCVALEHWHRLTGDEPICQAYVLPEALQQARWYHVHKAVEEMMRAAYEKEKEYKLLKELDK